MKLRPPQSALKGTALLFAGRTLNRFLGLGREVLSASFFGVGREMDAYNLAFTLVTSMRQLFAEQFLTPILPTYFQRRKESGETGALRSLNFITTRLNLITLLICLLLLFAARPVVHWLAPRFDAAQTAQTAMMVRWFAIGGLAFVLHRYYSGLYLCFFRYSAISFAPLLMNVGAIGAMVFFAVRYNVLSLAAGFSLGFLALFLALALFLPHRSELLKPHWGRGDPGVKTFGIMLLPLFLAVSVEQVQLFVDRSLASGLQPGALSAQGYALRLIRMSADIWLGTFGTVVFPIFSSLAASDKKEEFARNFSLALQAVMLFLFATGAIMVSLALPTVRLFLERGKFTPEHSELTASLLTYYAVAYIAQAVAVVIVRGFHAHGNTKMPMYAVMASVTVMIGADFLLVGPLGIKGLALAMAIGYILYMIIAYVMFTSHLSRHYVWQNVKVALLGLSLALPLGWIMHYAWAILEERGMVSSFVSRLIGVAIFTAGTAILYFLALRLLRVQALEFIIERIRQRRKKKPPVGEAI